MNAYALKFKHTITNLAYIFIKIKPACLWFWCNFYNSKRSIKMKIIHLWIYISEKLLT